MMLNNSSGLVCDANVALDFLMMLHNSSDLPFVIAMMLNISSGLANDCQCCSRFLAKRTSNANKQECIQ